MNDNIELQHRVREIAKEQAESFAQYIIDEAENRVTPERFDTDAVLDSLKCLSRWGFNVTDKAGEDGERGIGFAHPEQFAELRREARKSILLTGVDGPQSGSEPIGVYGVDIRADASLPEGTAIILHPDAVAPTPPSVGAGLATPDLTAPHSVTTRRPWLVRHPKGVVVVEVEADE